MIGEVTAHTMGKGYLLLQQPCEQEGNAQRKALYIMQDSPYGFREPYCIPLLQKTLQKHFRHPYRINIQLGLWQKSEVLVAMNDCFLQQLAGRSKLLFRPKQYIRLPSKQRIAFRMTIKQLKSTFLQEQTAKIVISEGGST